MTQPTNQQPAQDAIAAGSTDSIGVTFLAQGEQSAEQVAEQLAAFIAGAAHSLDLAIYDFRLSAPLKAIVAGALAERHQAGVAIRIAYDADKPAMPRWDAGMDPAPGGTGDFVQSLGYPSRRIGGLKLMHSKYLIRDDGLPDARVWTGTSNFTDDSWTLEENNILELASPQLAADYARDFAQLWQSGTMESSGGFVSEPAELVFAGAPARVSVLFSPGSGQAIDYDVARIVAQAQRRVRICSMLLNSGALLAALGDVLREGVAQVSGIYDDTQMRSVLRQWQDVPHNHWKISAVRDIIADARLVGKRSTPYSPTSRHDFMHGKTLVIDNTVITGSYNFSHSAEQNAENILMIESAALADRYSAYIDHLMRKYASAGAPVGDAPAEGTTAEGGADYD